MDLEIIVNEGEDAGLVFELASGATARVGRSPDCEIRLTEQGVSRYHCVIDNRTSPATLQDLESANGTLVNGEPVAEGTLQPGDELTLGPALLECRQSLVALPGPAATGKAKLNLLEGGDRKQVVRKVITATAEEVLADAGTDDQHAQRNLSTAFRISQLLVRAADTETVFQEIIDAIFKNSAAERAGLLLLEDRDDGRTGVRIAAARSRLSDRVIDDFSVSRSVVRDVLDNGASLLSWDAASDQRYRDQESIIKQQIRAVICAPVSTEERVIGVLYADNLSRPGAFVESDLDLLALIGNQAGIAIQRAGLRDELERSFLDTIRAIVATIDAKDGYTHHHSERVGEFAVRIGRELGQSEDELQLVRLSALVHDVGKVGVPESILNNPGELSPDEYEQMKLHPVHGVEILKHIRSTRLERILPGVRHHHERWDGSGYPDSLSGESIPLLGRLIAVADVLDALSSGRPYREKVSLDEAVKFLLENAGSHFDPNIVAAVARLHSKELLEVPTEGSHASPQP
jgi:HD-GYP domain-containing protein (c-di-GMP phosphodiesterase class II)